MHAQTWAQVFTKAWSAALLNALGDVLAQKTVDKNDTLDYKRLGIFTLLVRPTSLQHAVMRAAPCGAHGRDVAA
jgi:hypothetical protein